MAEDVGVEDELVCRGEKGYFKNLAQDMDKIVDAYMADSAEVMDELGSMTILNKILDCSPRDKQLAVV